MLLSLGGTQRCCFVPAISGNWGAPVLCAAGFCGTDGTLLWDQHLQTHRLQWDWGQFPSYACLRPEDISFGRVGSHVPE